MCFQLVVVATSVLHYAKQMERSANSTSTNDVETSLEKIVTLLNAGLDKRTTKVLIDLIESGIDPGSIADVIVELRQSTVRKN